MEEWKEYKLGDVCTIFGRIGFRGYTTDDLTNDPNQGAISLSPTNIVQGEIDLSKPTFIKWDKYYESPEIMVYTNDIVLVKTGSSIGRTAIIRELKHPITLNPQLVVLKDIKINSYYLSYLIKSYLFQAQLKSITVGSAIPTLSQKNLANLKICVPDLTLQNKTASILKSLDDKIENNRKINENLEQQAQALFKSWFVDFEPFRDQPFVESELGMIPEGWRVEELGKLIETTSGGTPSRKIDNYYNNGSIYWVKSKELLDNFIINTEEKITDVAIKESSAKLFPSHSVLIAMYGATVGAIGITTKSMACNQAICALLPNQLLPYTFLYLFAKFSKIYLQNKAVGSAQQNISQIIIKSLKVSYNSNAIKRFNSIVEPLLTIIEKNAFESHCLSHLRDTLLPKLMSGEITL